MTTIAYDQARMARRVPWIPDKHTAQCMLCAANFGLTCRRHHCRSCGLLVCNDCSKQTSREVPGYENEEVRICRSCFTHFFAVLVVWHSWFSYKHKLVSGIEEGKKTFDKLPHSASRLAVRMADGCIIDSWFKNEQWQNRVINRTQTHRRDMLLQNPRTFNPQTGVTTIPIPLPLNATDGSQTSPNSIITPTALSSARSMPSTQAPPSQGPNQLPSAPSLIAGQLTEVSHRSMHSPHSTFLNCFVTYRHVHSDPVLHAWIDVPSEPEYAETLSLVTAILEKASVHEAAVVSSEGKVLWAVDPTGKFSSAAAELHRTCLITVAWQSMEGPQMTTQCQYGDLPLATGRLDQRLPWVAIDSESGDLLSYRNCSVSALDVLCRTAGSAVGHLIAAVRLSNPSKVKVFNNAYVAHKEIRDVEDALLLACVEGFHPRVVSAHPSVMIASAMETILPHIEAALQSQRVVPPTVVDEESRQETLNCPICLERFTTEERRPCICGACGNTICLGCITSLRNCPYCRHEFTSARPPTNVALLAMIEAQATAASGPPSPLLGSSPKSFGPTS